MILQPVLVPIPQIHGLSGPKRVQQQREYARLVLRHAAKLCGAPLDGWRQGDDGAPIPNEECYWSISHKRTWAAAVIADRPVGIDVERLAPRKNNGCAGHRGCTGHRSLFDAVASSAEWDLLGDRSWHAFFRLWTAKEAVLKANGVGIGRLSSCRLAAIAVAPRSGDHRWRVEFDGQPWSIEHFFHDQHVVAVTIGTTPVHWHVLDDPGCAP